MLPMQMMNMFGAVRPKARERSPYGDARKQAIPTPEEAKVVLELLLRVEEKDPKAQQQLDRVREILQDLTEQNWSSFLGLSEDDFEGHNAHIAECLAKTQINTLETQAQSESREFVDSNVAFFDYLRDEGLNYDHLNEEQVWMMRVRMKERSISEKLEKNAQLIEGRVFYQYELGPDDRYYKSGGVVLRGESDKQVDAVIAEKVLDETSDDDFLGQFADLNALRMPTVRRTRSK
ncbi:MAG: hypothetical protein HRT36_01940 [Alphaproteobacteria bacterium]|nr:hypothetical protein [Alphaproteobacteria bacterium]